jgi:hypothetical protein
MQNNRLLVQLVPYGTIPFLYFFGGLECVGHSFAYVAHFVYLRSAVACRSATNSATHFPTVYLLFSIYLEWCPHSTVCFLDDIIIRRTVPVPTYS